MSFWGHFCLFEALIAIFGLKTVVGCTNVGPGRAHNHFGGLLIYIENFCFPSFALFLLYHVVLSSCGWRW